MTKHFCLPDRVDIQREIIKKSGVVMGKESFNHLSYSTILMAGRGSNWKYE